MSVNAPSFTPSGPSMPPAIPSSVCIFMGFLIVKGDYVYQRQFEDPYMYSGPRTSMFTVPFVAPQVIPGQVYSSY